MIAIQSTIQGEIGIAIQSTIQYLFWIEESRHALPQISYKRHNTFADYTSKKMQPNCSTNTYFIKIEIKKSLLKLIFADHILSCPAMLQLTLMATSNSSQAEAIVTTLKCKVIISAVSHSHLGNLNSASLSLLLVTTGLQTIRFLCFISRKN
jgi:hypothetical protein